MSRSIRALLALLAVSVALAASACANSTGPQQLKACDSNGASCTSQDYSNGNV